MKKLIAVFIFICLTSIAFAGQQKSGIQDNKSLSAGMKKGLDLIDKHDYKGAVKEFNRACDTGDGFACSVLGFVYLMGQSDNKSEPIKAITAYEKACKLKDNSGCFKAYKMYSKGIGVKVDQKKAIPFLINSCDYGSGQGCFVLGTLYTNGMDITKNMQKAQAVFEKSCKLGTKQACDMIGSTTKK